MFGLRCVYGRARDFSSIFINHVILARFTVDLEPVPGRLGVRWEHILDGTPVHHRTEYTHTDTPTVVYTQGQFNMANPLANFLEATGEPGDEPYIENIIGRRKPENQEKTHTLKTEPMFRIKLSTLELYGTVSVPPTVQPCRHRKLAPTYSSSRFRFPDFLVLPVFVDVWTWIQELFFFTDVS